MATTQRNGPQTPPSFVALAVIVLAFIGFSTLLPLFSGEARFTRSFADHLANPVRGGDLRHGLPHLEKFAEHDPTVYPPQGRYGYPPQSLPMTLWLRWLPAEHAYRVYVGSTIVAILALFAFATRRLGGGGLAGVLLAGVVLCLSQAGVYLLERGNLDGLGAVLALAAFLAVIAERWRIAAIALCLATCLKLIYLPLVLVLLWAPRPRRAWGTFLAAQVAMAVLVVTLYGSARIFVDYVAAFSSYASVEAANYGATNVSILSTAAIGLSWLGLERGIPFLMHHWASLAFLVLAISILARALGMGRDDARAPMRAFGALVYVTVLWQYRSATYGLMPLLACFAIGDVLHRAASDRGQRLLATTHAAALGLVFLPSEYHLPVVGQYKGAYLVVAAAFFVALAARDARASQPA